jgi:hypothetical protein
VHARELGGTWADIGEALSITPAEAEDRCREALVRWAEALDAPWAEAHGAVYSRMPDADPDFTIDYLDRWCLTDLAPTDAARSNARRHGVEEQMVSAGLPRHTHGHEDLAVAIVTGTTNAGTTPPTESGYTTALTSPPLSPCDVHATGSPRPAKLSRPPPRITC